MRLTRLRVENVRGVALAEVETGADFTFFTGPNGAGKTNMLEAVHLCATLRPLTTSVPQEVVRHGAPSAVVDGVLEGGVLPLPVRVVISGGRRRALVAGKPLRDAEAYTMALPTVSFTPDDLALVKSGPGGRRSFLTRAAHELFPAARAESRLLERALRQRAAALRRGAGPAVLDAIEGPLVNAAVAAWRRRQATLKTVLPFAAGWLAHLLDGSALDVVLAPGLPGNPPLDALDDAALAAHLRAAFVANQDEDRRRATTSSGPHHDDISVLIQGADARRFASQGQQRCAALALTLGVVDAVHQARGRPPLVLLDDVSSELDVVRRAALIGALAQSHCQVVASATDIGFLPLPPGFDGTVIHYGVRDGAYVRVE